MTRVIMTSAVALLAAVFAAQMQAVESECYTPTFGGIPGYVSRCLWPFSYKGKTYNEPTCSRVDVDVGAWCYISTNYEDDHNWGYCAERTCNIQRRDTESGEDMNMASRDGESSQQSQDDAEDTSCSGGPGCEKKPVIVDHTEQVRRLYDLLFHKKP